MVGTPVDTAHGTIIAFVTSGFAPEIMGFGKGGQNREAINTTHLATAAPGSDAIHNETFIPADVSDAGELTLDIHYNPETLPPINGPTEVITMTYPLATGDATPTIHTFNGFITKFDETGVLRDKMTATMTVKISGPITKTAATQV